MSLQENKQSSVGITLLEVLLTVALILVLSAEIFPLGIRFIHINQLKNTRDILISYLNTARIFSMGAKGGNSWGVRVSTENITMYKGNNYTTRDTAYDVLYNIPPSVDTSSGEIIFTKYSGETTEETILLQGVDNKLYTIHIDAKGAISYE